MTIACSMIGHGGYAMLDYAIDKGNSLYLFLARGVLIFFPNLESLNLKNLVATTAVVDVKVYLIAFALSIVYTGIIIFFAAWIFEKKSFDNV